MFPNISGDRNTLSIHPALLGRMMSFFQFLSLGYLQLDHFLVSLTSLPALVSNIFFILTSQEEGGLLLPSESEIVLWCLGSRNNSSVRRSAETTMRLSTAKLVDGRLVLDIHKNAFLQNFFFPPHFRVSYASGLEKQNFHPFKSLFFLTFAPCSFLF